MRLIYLDEAGTEENETKSPILCVAGILVHGDQQWGRLVSELRQVVEAWLPRPDWHGFVFHATDMFHGSRYWDRDVWPEEIRLQIMADLVAILVRNRIPVVANFQRKAGFGAGILTEESARPQNKKMVMYGVATANCLMAADRWIETYSPSENAFVTAENTDKVRGHMKRGVNLFRDPEALAKLEFIKIEPLKHLIDAIQFCAKEEAPLLQLADLCAFVLRRGTAQKHVPEYLWNPIALLLKATHAASISSEKGPRA